MNIDYGFIAAVMGDIDFCPTQYCVEIEPGWFFPNNNIKDAKDFIKDRYDYWKINSRGLLTKGYTYGSFTDCMHMAKTEWLEGYFDYYLPAEVKDND